MPCEPACTRDGGGHLVPRQLCPPLSPPPASHWGSRAQPCVANSRGPSCPPARVPSPPLSAGTAPRSLPPFITLGGAPSHSQVETFKPSPHSHPSAVPPPRRPCKWGPHVRCGRMSRPGLPRTRQEAALAQAMPLEGALREPMGNRRLPPAWKHREAPSEGRVGLGHQMLPRGAGTSGKWGGWGLGKRHGLERPQLGGLTLAPVKSDLVLPAPTCRLKDTCLPGTSQKAHI